MEECANTQYGEEFKMSDFEIISDENESVSDVADEELNLSQERRSILSIQELLMHFYVCP